MKERIQRIVHEMEKNHINTLLVFSPKNVYYISGFYTTAMAFWQIGQTACSISTDGHVHLFLPAPWSREYSPGDNVIVEEYENGIDNLAKKICSIFPQVFHADLSNISYNLYKELASCGATDIRDGEVVMRRCRMVKDTGEIETISKAVEIIDLGLSTAENVIYPGISELEVQARINADMLLEGSEGNGFTTKVIGGSNGSMAHHVSGQSVIHKGESVIVDLSATWHGYESDSARSFLCEGAEQEIVYVHSALCDLMESLPMYLTEGMPVSQLNRFLRHQLTKIAPNAIQANTIGHGVGLNAHEYPDVSPDCTEFLQENMVLAIEPALYMPGKYGIRIENMFLIKSSYTKTMNKYKLNRYGRL